MKVKSLSRVQLFVTSWIAAYQAPPSMGFSRQEYWSRVSSPSLAELPQSCPTLCLRMDFSPPAPMSMGLSRQEYWSGLPCPRLRDLPNPGIEPTSLKSPAFSGGFFTTGATWEADVLEVL